MQNRIHLGKFLGVAAAAGLIAFAAKPASAQLFTASGTLGIYTVAGEATFTQFADHIEIIFKNTSNIAVKDNPQVLTGLFFDISGSPIIGDTVAHRTVGLDGSSFVRINSTGALAD